MLKKDKLRNRRLLEVFLSIGILIPNLLALLRATDIQYGGEHMTYLIYTLLLFLIPSFWFRAKNFFYFQGITLLLGLVEVVHLIINEATTSLLFVHTIFLTEPREAVEMFSIVWPMVAIILIVVLVYYIIVYKYVEKHPFYPVWLRIVGGILLPMLVAFILYVNYYRNSEAQERDLVHYENNRVYQTPTLEKCFPLNLFVSTYRVFKQRHRISDYRKHQEHFSFGIEPIENPKPLTVVLVLGETARYSNFGVNGYQRETTPRLSGVENLVSFDSIYSIANLTVVSIPLMLSRATPMRVDLLSE